jgi:hypothetical protein
MSDAATRFLAALSVRDRSFSCPRTGLVVKLRAPSHLDEVKARAALDEAWNDREKHNLNALQYIDDFQIRLVGEVASIDGERLGYEAVAALDGKTLEHYVEQLDQLREESGETMSAADLDEAIDELKKKQSSIVGTLNTYEPAKLRALLAYTVGLLSSSPTTS